MQCIRCGMTVKADHECCSFCGHRQPSAVNRVRVEEEKSDINLGGWLILFQIRIYLQFALTLQILWLGAFFEGWILWVAGLMSLPYIYILSLFYRRYMRFRTVYTVTVSVYSLALIIIAVFGHVPLWFPIANGVIEGIILWALYKSKRVEHTFY